MENRYKVSVIIPVYNASEFLGQCLDSLLAQTLEDIELICVNDGSKDNSLEILQSYAAKDSRVKVIDQKNAGAGAARNHGLQEAQGKYLSFLDSDDFFEPDMLECAYHAAEAQNAQMTVFMSDQYFDETKQYKSVNWTIRKAALPPYTPIYFRTFTDNVFKVFVGWAWDKLFRRDFVLEHNLTYQELRTSNDLRFVFSALVLTERIAIVDKVLAHQRRNVSGSLSNTREKSWDCFYHALNGLKANLKEYGLYAELEQDFLNYVVHFSLWQLNTITGPKKQVLFEKLKQDWYEEFGVTHHAESYYYNKKEYHQYQRIMTCSYDEYLAEE